LSVLAERPMRASRAQLLDPAVIALVAVALLAFALRWASIHQSLFGDELFLYSRVHLQSFGQMLSLVHDNENTPPLFFIVAWLFAKGPDPMLLVRVPSLLANVGLVFLIFVLGRQVLGVRPALLGAAWFAISPFQIFYGTEDRAYSVVALLVVISTLAFLAAMRREDARWPWIVYAVTAIAALYTHYISLLVLAPQAAWGLWTHRTTIRRQLTWHGIVVLAALPWIPFFVLQARHSARESVRLSTLSPFTASNVAKTEIQSLIGHPFIAPGRLPGVVALVALGTVVLVALLWVMPMPVKKQDRWSGFLTGMRRALSTERGLLLLLAAFPLVGLVIYSIRPHTSLLLPRNLEVAAPYAALVFGWLVTRPPLRWGLVLATIAFAALAVGTVKILKPAYQRPDGRAAARYIDSHANVSATVIDFPGPQGTQFYFRHPHHLAPGGQFDWRSAAGQRKQVFLTYLSDAPCTPNPPFYHLVSSGSWPSVPLRLVVCEYLPRTQA
jgi:4-amino-4-deoxy-L-arabinose transferase-like glycosyltransferase